MLFILFSIFYSLDDTKEAFINNFNNINSPIRIASEFEPEYIEVEEAKGKYANSTYINIYKIPSNKFTYESSGDHVDNPLSNAFDGRLNTFWASSVVANGSSTAFININFTNLVIIEGIIYSPSYINTSPGIRRYDGFPLILNIYTSINEDEFILRYVLHGSPEPTDNWDDVQYIFGEAVWCNKLKIEFINVTYNNFHGNDTYPSCAEITFMTLPDEYLPTVTQSPTQTPLQSNLFSLSGVFTSSNIFTESNIFTPSNIYTRSSIFTQSNKFTPSSVYTRSSIFSCSNLFTPSNIYTKSSIFSSSHIFIKSNTFTSSRTFNSLSKTPSIKITCSVSYYITMVEKKSVTFSMSLLFLDIMTKSYIDDINGYIDVLLQTYTYKYFPYIIKYLSPSFIATNLFIKYTHKNKISSEQLIGITCGAASIFFLLIGLAIMIANKNLINKFNGIDDDTYEYTESDDVYVVDKNGVESNDERMELQDNLISNSS